MLVLGATLLSHAPALAQTPPLAQVSGESLPFSQIDVPAGLSESTPEVVAQIGSLQASASLPVSLAEQAALFVGASYGLLVVDHDRASSAVSDPATLHVLAASLLVSTRIAESWRLALRVELALAGDFGHVGGDHVRLSGASFVSYVFSPELLLGVGALASWRFGELLPLPALQVRWQIVQEVRLEAVLPVQAALTWTIDPHVELGLSASIEGQSYALTARREEWPCAAEDEDRPETLEIDERRAQLDRCASRLAFSRGEVGATFALEITSSLWLSVHAGLVFFRRYQLFLAEESGESRRDASADVSAIVQMQLALRLPER